MDFFRWKRGLKVALYTVLVYTTLAILFLILLKIYYLFKHYLQ